MAQKRPARSVEDVQAYLSDLFAHAIARAGMFGGELALVLYADAVAYSRGETAQWKAWQEQLQGRGASTPIGVKGAFSDVLGALGDDGQVASVYAEIGVALGWLTLDHTLTGPEYSRLRSALPEWVRTDRMPSDVIETWGPPSLHAGPLHPHSYTLLYAGPAADDPLVLFHFWNRSPWSSSIAEDRDPLPSPVLLAARFGEGEFASSFLYTPRGAEIRASLRSASDIDDGA